MVGGGCPTCLLELRIKGSLAGCELGWGSWHLLCWQRRLLAIVYHWMRQSEGPIQEATECPKQLGFEDPGLRGLWLVAGCSAPFILGDLKVFPCSGNRRRWHQKWGSQCILF